MASLAERRSSSHRPTKESIDLFDRLFRWSLIAVFAAMTLLLPPTLPSASAAASALPPLLLTLDGIQGGFDGQTKELKDAIVVDSFQYGASADAPPGGIGSPGKAKETDISLSKAFDSSSLPLLEALLSGKTIRDGYLYFQSRSAGVSRTYMVVHLSDIRVTSYSTSSGSSRARESLTLSAKSVLFKYMPSQPGDGGGTTPDPGITVLTKYHFEPINAVTDKGNPYLKGFKVTLQASTTGKESLRTQYRINGGEWIEYTGPFDIYAADTHTVEYYSSDASGRVESANVMDFDKGTFAGNGSY